ncbi:hypothetical protein MOVS_05235 [Moraxella ovis]|uniref:Uncharacterized protein n=1 Tax=Moraxella ovis TaxID=29433 RepID=A0A378PLU9_9GAMM|nr:hypothetical protein [Moraxella ovis]ANB91482.1 hypothetical protein MOVS_05235 [Moraxella ovis]STY87100.1 Uncharacterised protein [Moraxella ovis]
MGVNKIDFTLGNYNPNQAVGLIAMARENDRQISDSLKGILDGFEKTARQNADVRAMNYINSLDLTDLTPDKMAGHTQALQDISDGMGGLNPSKEALTALDGRGNVVAQRANNLANLEAQNILNQTNQIDLNNRQDAHALDTAVKTALSKPDSVEVIKNNLPTHLQGIFNHEFELYKLNQQNNYGDALNKVNAVRDNIENYKADVIIDKLRTVLPNFQDANGTVDYTKLFADKNVLTLLGEDTHNPSIFGKVLNKFDAKEAEKVKVAFDRMIAKMKADAAAAQGEAAIWNAKTNETKVNNQNNQFYAQSNATKIEEGDKKFTKTQESFNKHIVNTRLGTGGAISLTRDGQYSIDNDKLTANFVNSIKQASEIKPIVYKSPSKDAWWTNNRNFGVFKGWVGGEGLRNSIKTNLDNYKKPNGQPLTKDEYIGMAEILKSDMYQGDVLGSSGYSNRFPNKSYVKNNKLDIDALYAIYNRNLMTESSNRTREISRAILKEASTLGVDLGMIRDSLPDGFLNQYAGVLDADVLAILTGTNELNRIQGKWTGTVKGTLPSLQMPASTKGSLPKPKVGMR